MRISNDKNNILALPPGGAVILTKHRRRRLRGVSGVGDTENNALAVYYVYRRQMTMESKLFFYTSILYYIYCCSAINS